VRKHFYDKPVLNEAAGAADAARVLTESGDLDL
jgi:hypothetical protein